MGNVAYADADARIHSLMRDYFDVMYAQDMATFDRVFHPSCTLYGVVDGQPNLRSFEVYRAAVAERTSPAELGESRDDRVLDFDQISDTIAWVKPQLQMFGGVMQDYLNLVFVDGQWWVIAKMWQKVGDVD